MTASEPARRLQGKISLITGAASGIGRRIAEVFAEEGSTVVLADLDGAVAAGAAEDIVRQGGRASAATVDITSSESVESSVAEVLHHHGRLDVLVANAGISADGRAHEISEEHWNRVLAVNLTGTWHCFRSVLPAMMKQRGGSIVSTASITGMSGTPGTAAYSATKGGVIALTRQVATEYAQYGIRANAVCPGSIVTPLWLKAYSAKGMIDPDNPELGMAPIALRYPLRRVGTVEDVAMVTVFLASDESNWMTGLAIPVDGGATSTAWQAT